MFPDAPSATQASTVIKLELGEDRSIGCPGNTPAVITWYKGNDTSGRKMTNCSTLEVENFASSDEGRYTCFAKNATVRFLLVVGKVKFLININHYRIWADVSQQHCQQSRWQNTRLKQILVVFIFFY